MKKKDDKSPKKEQKFIHLQWVGKTPAVKASELKPGDVTVWNGGATAKVSKVEVSKSGKTVAIEYIDSNGKKIKDSRKFRADRLIGIDKTASKPLKADKYMQPKKVAEKPAVKRSEPKPAAPKKESTAAKKAASAKNKAADKLLKHSDKDEMNFVGEKPIVINAKNAKPKRAPKVLRRVARTGGYTAWDDIKKSGKTFGTEKEARDYAADVLKKTGKVVPVSFTNKQVTHTYKPEEQTKKK